jgi:hypothetical protein
MERWDGHDLGEGDGWCGKGQMEERTGKGANEEYGNGGPKREERTREGSVVLNRVVQLEIGGQLGQCSSIGRIRTQEHCRRSGERHPSRFRTCLVTLHFMTRGYIKSVRDLVRSGAFPHLAAESHALPSRHGLSRSFGS